MGDSKIGRNDPCWCGSGKKFKKCCWPRASISADVPADSGSTLAMSGAGGAAAAGGIFTGRWRSDAPRLTGSDLEAMRRACRFNAELMDHVRREVRPGVSTGELDRIVHEYTLDHGHTPACLGYRGSHPTRPYPKSICTSINEVICHGIPSDDEILEDGDIVNLDLTTIVDGWHGDQSETFLIGNVSEVARRLVQVTFDCMWAGIRAIRPHQSVNEIGRAIVELAHANDFSVVEDYQGHGIGREFHQEPSILHYPNPKFELVDLVPGNCFTVEPMINEGRKGTKLDHRDGWTVRTKDGKLSAQFEHTVVVTETGVEILTLTQDGPQEGHRF
ncbi:MAG: type I methionyl aminopeptidase [Planctomycetes bacterium]|nr:type I methionyl aminopeptidase [Planctomycetota bacterium]